MTLTFIKGYKDNVLLRRSLNELALNTFGIQFETWYQHGFWTEKYQPYSYMDKQKVVANVSANLINLVINGEIKSAIQIGTVMTHPDYRNKGLTRKLMEMVLEDFKYVDLIYLFANETVLEFYPKFGFQVLEEAQYYMDYTYKASNGNGSGIIKLNGKKAGDLSFIYSIAAKRKSVSQVFGTTSTEELFMFYCIMVYSQDIYFLQEENALVLFQHEGKEMHIYDVVSEEDIDIHTIISKIAVPETKRVIFHYHPDYFGLEFSELPYHSSTVLFVKNQGNISLTGGVKHPLTAQA
ncbi:GNAT family N-acetyltransferase [Neobacillus cucumis]|uniref:GNAT family N-acetyltransferase n=1 Tax=Neobacillus cucumis TaxID=1740721 RepID=A0A2N5HBF3_9BACI|nr:GNAT family N-acetyltransferase [Neobacillus cucumis]PLS02851.1 GNAT family N-acetyltransferase [Neobacillus cucumis]